MHEEGMISGLITKLSILPDLSRVNMTDYSNTSLVRQANHTPQFTGWKTHNRPPLECRIREINHLCTLRYSTTISLAPDSITPYAPSVIPPCLCNTSRRATVAGFNCMKRSGYPGCRFILDTTAGYVLR